LPICREKKEKNPFFIPSKKSVVLSLVLIPERPGKQGLRANVPLGHASSASWELSTQPLAWHGVRKDLQTLIDHCSEMVKLVALTRILWFVENGIQYIGEMRQKAMKAKNPHQYLCIYENTVSGH
jgi:hypothetical protein